MPVSDLADAVWRTSSYSNTTANECVEVAHRPRVVGIRDSKDRDGGMLTVPAEGWSAFLAAVRA
ncbi:DUF397 domain-containing protein [Amycolatopsis cihanbeyliensis]|uniref:Uncharacterized protein DUF397 n=1 Tax=Amycolatopsis cihanbeyliensis TaxID=1128664 RepID=A0A542DKS4_AMYCI|nr:DUF397 domain-containing protein [Amycolatopsis cihanbeyliensis]TQJ03663.1 uncharacterized protein DUF397 [Amycolatopsis cihanbeyliensis]